MQNRKIDISEFKGTLAYGKKTQQMPKHTSRVNHKTAFKLNLTKIAAAFLTASVLTTGAVVAAIKSGNENIATSSVSDTSNSPQQEILNNSNIPDIELVTYPGTDYYVCSLPYVNKLAKVTLAKVKSTLSTVNGITPMASDSGDFYPAYFDEHLLTAIAYTESGFRTVDENGVPLTSNSGALGMMQIRPDTLTDVNNWLKNTMELDLQYSVEDLSDPAKSMEIATYYLIQTCKNHAKMNCNNPIFPYLKENFSYKRQEEIILAIYNNGYNKMLSYINDGTVYEYLSEGSKDNYVNKIITLANQLREQYNNYYQIENS